jgi:hypothetical protein
MGTDQKVVDKVRKAYLTILENRGNERGLQIYMIESIHG